METFIVHPSEDGPHPVVVFLMDAPGMREELRNMCRRLASAGYYVAAPHLYYRSVDHYNVFETGDRDLMFELMGELSNTLVCEDIGAVLAIADGDPAADSTSVGTVGYCMSGPFALMAAPAFPGRVKAAASIHGVALAVDAEDSPHRHIDASDAELYVACAEVDEYAPPEMIAEYEKALAASDTPGRVEWYPETHHGFAFAERPLYVQAASERHWECLHSLFRRNLHA